MAEEDIESLAVLEKGELGIFATGKPSSSDKKCASEGSSGSRQDSTAKTSITKKNQKVSPNYLRASTGSCHDFCKYGIKHGFEHEETRPWRKKKSVLTSSSKQNCVVTVALPERRKSMVARSVSFPVNDESLLQDEVSSGAVISPNTPEIIKREISLPRKKLEESSKPERSSDKTMMLKKGKRMTDFSKERSPSAMRQPSSYASEKSGRNTEKDETRLSYSSPKISPPLYSQQVKSGLSSSVARSQPVKARLSSSLQIEGSIKETIKSSNMKSDYLRHSTQAAGGLNVRNKKSEVKISEINTKLSSSTQSSRTVNERGKKSDINTRNNMAAFSAAAKQTRASHRPSISGTTAIKPKKVGSLKVVSPPKDQNRLQKTKIGKTRDENVPEKTLHVVEVETNAKLSESTEAEAWDITPSLSPPRSKFPPAHEEVEVWSSTPHFPQSSISPVLSLRQGMSLSDHGDVVEEKVEAGKGEEKEEDADGDEVKEEKEQLYQEELEEEVEEEMETEEDSDGGEEEEEYIDESDDGGEFINGNEIFNYDDVSAVEGNICKPLKKGYVISDSRDSEQVKLKFRRGKVLDIQSENKGPRRLRFRRARIVEESQGSKNETNRRNFSRRDIITKGNSDSTGDEKIVLRHQDMQGKKDAQGSLLNIVLEETASKLVETRKSKVKALVGAFETVISLHDSKPSAQTVA